PLRSLRSGHGPHGPLRPDRPGDVGRSPPRQALEEVVTPAKLKINPTAPTLSRRALNRALLARQLLLSRSDQSVADALTHLVGLQAQTPNAPYLALWSRLNNFDHQQLSSLILDRRVVRIALMRGTIHSVTDADCLEL